MTNPAEPDLPQKVLAVHDALSAAYIAHQFGGALALAYCVGEPRATNDIDVNIVEPPENGAKVLAALPQCDAPADVYSQLARDGQVRLSWNGTPVDLFFAYHPFHDHLARSARMVPFADREIPIISGEGLVVCKAMFNRRKDWQDIEAVAAAGATDLRAARTWLETMTGPTDPRMTKLGLLIDEYASTATGRIPPDQATRDRVNAVFAPATPPPPSPAGAATSGPCTET